MVLNLQEMSSQKNIYYVKNYLLPTENNIPYYQSQFSIGSCPQLSNLMGSHIEYSTVIEREEKQRLHY